MTKSQYNQLFAKAKEFFSKNNNKVTTATSGYAKFKSACDLLIASTHNDIEISTDPNNKYAHYQVLNQQFSGNTTEELLNEEW